MPAQSSRVLPATSLDVVDESIRERLRALVAEHTLTTVSTRLGVSRGALRSYLDDHARRGSVVLIETQARSLFAWSR